ncbi:DNA methyltransferase [Hydrogenimonas thermophila]|uniref:DNA methyltransferase n=1 Tax=Hydrogenimonas thermophila TaxID=223786 RepID=UPI002936F9BA|nr:DNA methyltransferase [Hydrogenimonas thermophila]WOE68900.1 DNA methyltransferase [Hydrogenimonas thermophila]WOE71408.1 DNA methyltransferase [Hydrogenimonas thermophila]
MTAEEKFKELLKKIFQYNKDKIDLDFGVYRVFKHKEVEIQNFIEKKLPSFIKENLDGLEAITIYNHVLEFFERYYQDGDFYPIPIYATTKHHILRHNGEEIIFSWANKDQYYIKSIENFSVYKIRRENLYNDDLYNTETQAVNFIVNEIDDTKGNNKTARVFTLSSKKAEFVKNEGFNIYLDYKYKSKNITEIDENELFKIIQNAKINLTIEEITHHLRKFKNLRKSDFFIHKRLEAFLNEELDYYLKTNVLKDIDTLSEIDIKTTQVVKKVGQFIIKFIASLEELQKILWEKKKFAYDVNYIITLDKIPNELIEEILEHKNFKNQIDEWIELNLIEEFKKDELYDNLLNELKPEYKYLPLDTKNFDDEELKYKILENIENLDETIDGILINSDNFHALNLVLNKYKGKLKCVYIDPPYNTGSDEFIYKDSYRHSSWLSLMENRLMLMKKMFSSDTPLFISIDDRELCNLKQLMNDCFNEFASKTIVVKTAEPTGKKMASVIKTGSLPKLKEYVLIFKKNKISGFNFERIPKKEWDKEYKTILLNVDKEEMLFIKSIRDNKSFTDSNLKKVEQILSKIELTSLSNYAEKKNIKIDDEWKYKNAWRIVRDASLEGSAKLIADEKNLSIKERDKIFYIITSQKKMYFIKSGYNMEVESPRVKLLFADDYLTLHCGDFWSDIKTTGLDNEGYIEFLNAKKPLKLINRLITSVVSDKKYILDYFAGSGTTGQAVIQNNINEKKRDSFLLCETNEYFESKLKKRILLSIYNEKYSSIIKYYRLEQYEDTLENSKLKKSTDTKSYIQSLEPLKEYMNELYNTKYLTLYKDFVKESSKALLMDDTVFNDPFNFTLKVNIDSKLLEKKMDLVETFNTLKGIEVKSIKLRYFKNKKYVFVDGKNEVVIWREFDIDTLNQEEELEFIKVNCDISKELYINGISQTHTKKELVAKESIFELRALLVEGVK